MEDKLVTANEVAVDNVLGVALRSGASGAFPSLLEGRSAAGFLPGGIAGIGR